MILFLLPSVYKFRLNKIYLALYFLCYFLLIFFLFFLLDEQLEKICKTRTNCVCAFVCMCVSMFALNIYYVFNYAAENVYYCNTNNNNTTNNNLKIQWVVVGMRLPLLLLPFLPRSRISFSRVTPQNLQKQKKTKKKTPIQQRRRGSPCNREHRSNGDF